jgi:hypothetical protein
MRTNGIGERTYWTNRLIHLRLAERIIRLANDRVSRAEIAHLCDIHPLQLNAFLERNLVMTIG